MVEFLTVCVAHLVPQQKKQKKERIERDAAATVSERATREEPMTNASSTQHSMLYSAGSRACSLALRSVHETKDNVRTRLCSIVLVAAFTIALTNNGWW